MYSLIVQNFYVLWRWIITFTFTAILFTFVIKSWESTTCSTFSDTTIFPEFVAILKGIVDNKIQWDNRKTQDGEGFGKEKIESEIQQSVNK